MDGTGFDRWFCDHRVHGDILTGFVLLHLRNDVVHDHGADERYGLYVHGDGNEYKRYGSGVLGFGLGDSVDGSWCTNVGVGDQ